MPGKSWKVATIAGFDWRKASRRLGTIAFGAPAVRIRSWAKLDGRGSWDMGT